MMVKGRATIDPPPFSVHGPHRLRWPVLITVPHAGRYYPAAMLAQARVPLDVLERLEDRHCDALIDDAAGAGFAVQIATYARAWIDLNRAEYAWDGALVADAQPVRPPDRRVRAGLGLVPRQLHPDGALWRTRMTMADLNERIVGVHRPWHASIQAQSTAMAARFGHAALIDLHSMPSQPGGTPAIVIGDRFGQTASNGLIDRLIAIVEGHGFSVARNVPYAGAHAIERHGDRHGPVEAVQIEIDRALYLTPAGETDAARARPLAALVAALAQGAANHCLSMRRYPIAAE